MMGSMKEKRMISITKKNYNHGEMALARNVKLNKTTNLFKNKHKP